MACSFFGPSVSRQVEVFLAACSCGTLRKFPDSLEFIGGSVLWDFQKVPRQGRVGEPLLWEPPVSSRTDLSLFVSHCCKVFGRFPDRLEFIGGFIGALVALSESSWTGWS